MSSSEMVTISIDGKEVSVPKGMNLIEAGKIAGVSIPYYCYHKHLSIAGNCRMCQIEIEGAPKLSIACNTGAQEGMKVKTQVTSELVKEAQRATLEFLLINHPLDCTVCDQAGHCKLQDYYFDYNKTASRFIEEKTHKVKAESLGPEVMYDGERCIVCTRCVRFCDEYTETSELTVLNRGDRTVIAVHEDKPLDNPYSGCTVDLCPVGALTHKQFRFNSRIWYADEKETICVGCSTGCNAKVAVRDDQFVQVKGRLNSEVNQEWLCNEGRYGFNRFAPQTRLLKPLYRNGSGLDAISESDAYKKALDIFKSESAGELAVFVSPFLTTEELEVIKTFLTDVCKMQAPFQNVAMQVRKRKLNELEQKLISPDYAPNARAAEVLGFWQESSDWRSSMEAQYDRLLAQTRAGVIKRVALIGDFSILDSDLDEQLSKALLDTSLSVAITPRGVITAEGEYDQQNLGAHQLCSLIIPSFTVYEKNGIFINSTGRVQRLNRLITPQVGTKSEWDILNAISKLAGKGLLANDVTDDRSLSRALLAKDKVFSGLTLANIGKEGVSLSNVATSGNA
jgi:NADH-quinone oxidoreductase subunit G